MPNSEPDPYEVKMDLNGVPGNDNPNVMYDDKGVVRDIGTEDGWYDIGDRNMPDEGYADLVDVLSGKAAYVPGQETRKDPTDLYLEVAQEAIRVVADKERA